MRKPEPIILCEEVADPRGCGQFARGSTPSQEFIRPYNYGFVGHQPPKVYKDPETVMGLFMFQLGLRSVSLQPDPEHLPKNALDLGPQTKQGGTLNR